MGNNKRMSFKKGQKSSATFPKDYVNSTEDETLDEISSSESIQNIMGWAGNRGLFDLS